MPGSNPDELNPNTEALQVIHKESELRHAALDQMRITSYFVSHPKLGNRIIQTNLYY